MVTRVDDYWVVQNAIIFQLTRIADALEKLEGNNGKGTKKREIRD